MPRRDARWIRLVVLTLVCSWAIGCGITSKRTSLEEIVEDLDDARDEPMDADQPAELARAQTPGRDELPELDPLTPEIDLVSAEELSAEPADPADDEEGAFAGSGRVPDAPRAVPAIEHVNGDSFQAEVLAAPTPVLVDFSAEWCGPCKKLAPVLQELAADTPDVKIVQVDIDESKQLAKTYRVRSVPTLILFKQGEPVSQHRGLADRGTLDALLAR